MSVMSGPNSTARPIDYFLVLDFEATCDSRSQPTPQEIIEFPVLKVNARTLQTEAEFHMYVCPTFHPVLTTFCTELTGELLLSWCVSSCLRRIPFATLPMYILFARMATGITQSMVDGQPTFTEVFGRFHQWMDQNGLLDPNLKSCFVTCGDWDLKTMLPSQCTVLGLNIPDYFKKWINIKKIFTQAFGIRAGELPMMSQNLGLQMEGRYHSGIDDCRNIAKILVALVAKLGEVQPTTQCNL